MKKQLLFSLIICFNALALHAQFGQQWLQTYDDSLHQNYIAYGIALDHSDHVVVVGSTFDAVFSPKDIRIVKYDAFGQLLWDKIYPDTSNAYYPPSVAIDANDNILISVNVSQFTGDYYLHLIKYNPVGQLMWDSVFTVNLGTHNDYSNKIELDAAGNIYLGGTIDFAYPGINSFGTEADIIKFDSSGNFVTEMRTGPIITFPSINYQYTDGCRDLTIADGRTIYSITDLEQDTIPFSFVGWQNDFGVQKHDTSGSRYFLKRILRPTTEDFPNDIFVDVNEDLFITGYTKDTTTSLKARMLTVKLDSSGNEIYIIERGDTAWHSEGRSIVADQLGYAYVNGYTTQFGQGDIVLIKYDPSGNEVWVRTYNSPFNNYDIAGQLYIDSSANLYQAGQSSNGNNIDWIILKYDSAGTLLWEQRYNGPANQDEMGPQIKVNATSEIFAAGASQGSNGFDFLAIKYGLPTSISEMNSSQNSFSVYPNPASEELTVQSSKEIIEMKIFNVFGKEIYQTTFLNPSKKFNISCANLPAGIYFIQVNIANRNVTQKFVKL